MEAKGQERRKSGFRKAREGDRKCLLGERDGDEREEGGREMCGRGERDGEEEAVEGEKPVREGERVMGGGEDRSKGPSRTIDRESRAFKMRVHSPEKAEYNLISPEEKDKKTDRSNVTE